MKPELFLGIDQGSSSTKGVLIDQDGLVLEEWRAPVPDVHRDGRRMEQDPAGLLSSVQEVFQSGLEAASRDDRPLRAWGLAVQRSGVLAWDSRSGAVLHPMITWADTRSEPIVASFGKGVEKISNLTGLPVLANFAGPKIHLLQRQFLDPWAYVATLDSYLVHLLSKLEVFATEDSMAARTMLYGLQQRGWSDELCRQFQVDKQRLPRIVASFCQHTVVDKIPLMAVLGDQQAALLGRCNMLKRPLLNLGTIASLAIPTESEIVRKPAIKTSVLHSRQLTTSPDRDVKFLVESTSDVTGTVLLEPLRRAWCHDTRELSAICDEAFAAHPAGLAISYWVDKRFPSPVWPHGVPNVTVCKPEATTRDRVRAVVENVGNLIARVIEECAEKCLLGERFPAEIDVAGGGSDVEYLMQYVADITGHTLNRLVTREAGARGAALAALSSVHPNIDIRKLNRAEVLKTYRCIDPDRRKRYLMWQRMEQDVLNKRLPGHAEIEEEK